MRDEANVIIGYPTPADWRLSQCRVYCLRKSTELRHGKQAAHTPMNTQVVGHNIAIKCDTTAVIAQEPQK